MVEICKFMAWFFKDCIKYVLVSDREDCFQSSFIIFCSARCGSDDGVDFIAVPELSTSYQKGMICGKSDYVLPWFRVMYIKLENYKL